MSMGINPSSLMSAISRSTSHTGTWTAEYGEPELHDYKVTFWNRWANESQCVNVRAHDPAEAKAMVWYRHKRRIRQDGTFDPITETEAEDITVAERDDTVLTPGDFAVHELDSTIELIRGWEDGE